MIPVRAAVPADAPELARLRGVMFAAMGKAAEDDHGPWRAESERAFREQLAAPAAADEPPGAVTPLGVGVGVGGLVGFVVDDPGRPGRLAACAVGTLDRRLPTPRTAGAVLVGHVSSVCTDPEHRRRGYSRVCVEQLLAWYDRHGVARVHLNATDQAEGLYRSLGFTDPGSTPLTRLSPDAR
ncbi:GNAT family N-acetyltransferase [Streptacidiphilus cavernicola]|uniref:GNAT family N-acetyltransferase n=1 Tax=Streptacidiphilus cavernicola TaxID=3342716 RepID=A0ABV6VUT6_9ACTN